MCSNEAKAFEVMGASFVCTQIRDRDAVGISYGHMAYIPLSVEGDANNTTYSIRDAAHFTSKLTGHRLHGMCPSAVQVFYGLELRW